MRQPKSKPGAVVLGSDFKALGVVRSLGKRGIPSVVIDNQPRSAWFSRYVTKRFKWNGEMDDDAFLHFLLSVGKAYQLDQWMLFPLQDEVVEFVARNTSQLSQVFQLVTQDWDTVQWVCDKRLTYRMAQNIGIPYPQTWYPTNERDLQGLEITYPAILKPANSIKFQHATHLKAITVHNDEDLISYYRQVNELVGTGEIMVQQLIPGGGKTQYSVGAYCKDGQTLLAMTAQRTRQYPIDFGLGSSFVEAVEVPAINEPARKLLAALHITGMVEVEFKYDERDHQYKLLDVNLRPWGWHTLCTACGMDFSYIQYRDRRGFPPAPITPRYGPRWVRLITDIPAGLQERRAGIATTGAYLRSLRGKLVFSVFDWRDPLPTVGDFFSVVIRSLRGSRRADSVDRKGSHS